MMGIYYISLFPFNFWQWESYAEKKFILYMLMKFIFEMFGVEFYICSYYSTEKKNSNISADFIKFSIASSKLSMDTQSYGNLFIFLYFPSFLDHERVMLKIFIFYALMKFIFETFSENLCHQIIRPFIT